MADRDDRLGTFGMYSREGVERHGLRFCMERTLEHLDWRLRRPFKDASARDEVKDEIVRLRRVALTTPWATASEPERA